MGNEGACFDVSMEQTPVNGGYIRIASFLFLALTFLFLVTSSGRVRTVDELAVNFQGQSLITHGTTAVPQAVAANRFYGKVDRRGQPRAPYGEAQALLEVPWHVAARVLWILLPQGSVPADSKYLFMDAVVTSSSAAFSALAATLAFLIFCYLGIAVRTALAAALMIALATQLFAYSTWLFSEPLVASLMLAAALALFIGQRHYPLRGAALAGLFLGIMIWIRPTHVIAVPVFFLAVLIRDREQTASAALTLALIAGIFGGAYLLRNQIYFGGALDFGYPKVAEAGKRIISFETPIATGLFGFLLSPGKSVFLFAPPILLAIPGVWRLAKRDLGLGILAGGMPLVSLLFFSRYTQWEGGFCVGPRYLVPSITLLCLGLGPMLADAGARARKLAIVLFAAGVLVQAVSISTSFVEDQVWGNYYDSHWNYRMDYSSIASQGKLLLHYLSSSEPARLGLGYDRWFVFLAKAGARHSVLACGLFFELLGLGFFSWKLRKAVMEFSNHEPSKPVERVAAAAVPAE
jgi:hypothetical protein